MNYRAEIAAMLRTMPSDWRRQYRSGREKLGYGLPDAPTPEQAMMLIGITAGGHESGDIAVGPNRVPDAVREAAMQGLRLSHRHNYGAWDFIGVARAIELVLSTGVSNRTVERMRNYFVRHQKDKMGKNFGNDAAPSRGYMAWLNWGGEPGQEWTMKKRNPRYSVVTTTPGFPVLDVVKATYSSRQEALDAVTLGPAHEHRPWRKHGQEYEWTGAQNIWVKPARMNPSAGTKAAFYAQFNDNDMDAPVNGYTRVRRADLGPHGLRWADGQRAFVLATVNRINQAVAKADKSSPQTNNEAIGDLVAAYANMKFAMNVPYQFMESVGGERGDDGDFDMPTPGAAAVMEVLQAQSEVARRAWSSFSAALEKVARNLRTGGFLTDAVTKVMKNKTQDEVRAALPGVTARIVGDEFIRKQFVGTLILLKKYAHALVPPGATPCPRCGGVGFLAQFMHVEQGTCFACDGTGVKRNSSGVRMRRNPMSIVADGNTFRIFLDGVDTGKYALSRDRAEEILARLEASAGATKREKKERPVDPFALRPFAVPVRPPAPWHEPKPARPRGRQDLGPSISSVSGPAPYAKDAKGKWSFVKAPVSGVATWGYRSTFRTGNNVRVQVEPLEPSHKGYSVLYILHPMDTEVAYLVKDVEHGRLIDLYDVTAAWFLTELDDNPPRRVTEKVLTDAVNNALKSHPLRDPSSYMLGRS